MATRLNVNINDETEAALKELALENQVSVTEVVRRAVSVYKYVTDELARPDVSLQIVDKAANEKTTLQLV